MDRAEEKEARNPKEPAGESVIVVGDPSTVGLTVKLVVMYIKHIESHQFSWRQLRIYYDLTDDQIDFLKGQVKG